jgi:hypothetical protein
VWLTPTPISCNFRKTYISLRNGGGDLANVIQCRKMLYTTYFKEAEANYLLYIQVFEATKDSKYIGVAISNDRSCENHTRNITVNANLTIDFLRRNKHACPKEVKAVAYTLVRLFNRTTIKSENQEQLHL